MLSAANARLYNVNGQNFYCVDAWPTKINFHPNEIINQAFINLYPNSIAAVDATDGIIMTHPSAPLLMGIRVINAQFRDETGWFTSQGYFDADPQTNDPVPWLREVFDPISAGSPKPGMGQQGSRRWSWGKAGSAQNPGPDFPKWDYRRILAHYYSEVDFVGISPDPPNDNRGNIIEVEGIPPNGGLIMCRGEKLPGVTIDFQNVGNALPVNTCPAGSNAQSLVGYHIYKQDGSLVSTNYLGLRATPLCQSGGVTMPPGRNYNATGFEIFIPNDPAILKGQTYLLRFDLKRNGVWQGYNTGYPWRPRIFRLPSVPLLGGAVRQRSALTGPRQ